MIKNGLDMRSYKSRVRELVKVLNFQMDSNIGFIDLNKYSKSYNMTKSQILQELKNKKILKRYNNYILNLNNKS